MGCLSPGGSEEDLMVELLRLETRVNPSETLTQQQWSLSRQHDSWDFKSLTLWIANVIVRLYFSDVISPSSRRIH